MNMLKLLPGFLVWVAVLTSPATSKAQSSPSLMDTIVSYFTQDFTQAKRTLGFMRTRAQSAKLILASTKITPKERSRRLHIEVNRAYNVLQDNRRALSRDVYNAFKNEVDLAHYHVVMHDKYAKKNLSASAQWHYNMMAAGLENTLNTIYWIELLTGGAS